MGKPAVNMKPSHLKQVLKSCKGGITLTIHRPPRGALHYPLPSSEYPEYCTKTADTLPSPGTPGSGASDTSMGYSSSHSLPSVFSTPGPPVAKDNKDGNGSIGERSQTASHSTGYDTDLSHHLRPNSVCSLAVAGTNGSSRLAGSPGLTLHRGGISSTQFGQLNEGGVRPHPPTTPSTPTSNLLTRNLSDGPGASRGDISSTRGSSHQFSARGATPTLLRNPEDEGSNFRSTGERQEEQRNTHKPHVEQQTCL